MSQEFQKRTKYILTYLILSINFKAKFKNFKFLEPWISHHFEAQNIYVIRKLKTPKSINPINTYSKRYKKYYKFRELDTTVWICISYLNCIVRLISKWSQSTFYSFIKWQTRLVIQILKGQIFWMTFCFWFMTIWQHSDNLQTKCHFNFFAYLRSEIFCFN